MVRLKNGFVLPFDSWNEQLIYFIIQWLIETRLHDQGTGTGSCHKIYFPLIFYFSKHLY